ncbi:hypothetical protein KUM39_09675 [Streptomyces sp. J2-1]|uniref:hypothetical protein n=1 Tax=Streptomyces corallincola TaxID=2851888 RepID=UPI001C392159|nr:hypothetical protein [Streptomyces corallincola]MBV2354628.1 hypothetical protein [Streptomyces corallincola]
MPRGRHRHSPPLHRLLPASAIAGVSVVCALGPWVFTDAVALRLLAAAAALTAVVGAVVLRRWDSQAGKQVADLTRARASDEWRFEERVAELETDLDEFREVRGRLEGRLRAKRAELAGLRNEHAALLRRYATAETERASALEGRRLLEIEAAEPSSRPALPPARRPEPEPAVPAPTADGSPAGGAFSAGGAPLYRRAAAALSRLDPDGASARTGHRTAGRRTRADGGGDTAAVREDESRGKSEAADGHPHAVAATPAPEAAPVRPPGGHYAVPTAVAVVPAPVRRPAVEGRFDFFGTQQETASAALESVQHEDLADVVGAEALALHEAGALDEPADEAARGVGQVIDLTAHDETEQIDVQGLRSAAS